MSAVIIKQHDLFNDVIPASIAEIDGLAYIPDYIDAISEDALISTIDGVGHPAVAIGDSHSTW
jgi:hypothetical protein